MYFHMYSVTEVPFSHVLCEAKHLIAKSYPLFYFYFCYIILLFAMVKIIPKIFVDMFCKYYQGCSNVKKLCYKDLFLVLSNSKLYGIVFHRIGKDIK